MTIINCLEGISMKLLKTVDIAKKEIEELQAFVVLVENANR